MTLMSARDLMARLHAWRERRELIADLRKVQPDPGPAIECAESIPPCFGQTWNRTL